MTPPRRKQGYSNIKSQFQASESLKLSFNLLTAFQLVIKVRVFAFFSKWTIRICTSFFFRV